MKLKLWCIALLLSLVSTPADANWFWDICRLVVGGGGVTVHANPEDPATLLVRSWEDFELYEWNRAEFEGKPLEQVEAMANLYVTAHANPLFTISNRLHLVFSALSEVDLNSRASKRVFRDHDLDPGVIALFGRIQEGLQPNHPNLSVWSDGPVFTEQGRQIHATRALKNINPAVHVRAIRGNHLAETTQEGFVIPAHYRFAREDKGYIGPNPHLCGKETRFIIKVGVENISAVIEGVVVGSVEHPDAQWFTYVLEEKKTTDRVLVPARDILYYGYKVGDSAIDIEEFRRLYSAYPVKPPSIEVFRRLGGSSRHAFLVDFGTHLQTVEGTAFIETIVRVERSPSMISIRDEGKPTYRIPAASIQLVAGELR